MRIKDPRQLPKNLQAQIQKERGHVSTLRIRTVSSLKLAMPEIARIVLNYYNEQSISNNRSTLYLTIPKLPPSVNHQYTHTRFSTRLTDSAKDFRRLVGEMLVVSKARWSPKGVTAAVLFFESPLWVTKQRGVRNMDIDNKVKPTFDAIEKATEVPDELHWQFHVFKAQSRLERTTAYLFDIGDLVDSYQG